LAIVPIITWSTSGVNVFFGRNDGYDVAVAHPANITPDIVNPTSSARPGPKARPRVLLVVGVFTVAEKCASR